MPTRLLLILCLVTCPAAAQQVKTFVAQDTLRIETDPSSDAQTMLDDLAWPGGGAFEVVCEPARAWGGDALVRFDSPRPAGEAINDRVCLEWHAARDGEGGVIDAPAVVVIHEAASSMVVGRLIAAGLAQRGVHGFLMHLPGYGDRRAPGGNRADQLPQRVMQGIADARRARDAVAVLPHVDAGHIALQGTSLGGFVAGPTAGLDDAFDSVWIAVSGGRLDLVLTEGDRDAALVRRSLEEAGLDAVKIVTMARRVEPTRLAHRISPHKLYLVTAIDDTVVPRASADALASAAGLSESHHLIVPGDHYTAMLVLPGIMDRIVQTVRGAE